MSISQTPQLDTRNSSLDDAETPERTRLLSISSGDSIYRSISRQGHGKAFLPAEEDGSGPSGTDSEPKQKSPWETISVLLVGVFMSQLDASLVLATYGKIASDFHELDAGSWLLSAYILAQCAIQPLYGKLSDIYGRKACLLGAYISFTIGTLGVGQSRTLLEIILWRACQGIGGAGMVSIVSIIVTDIVPKHEVASILGYVNILQTMGRSCGGVVGGLLTQAIGWRWAFLIQVPPMVLAIILVAWKLHLPSYGIVESRWTKLKRVDFVGALFLTSFILSVCLIIDLGGRRLAWDSLQIKIIAAIASATGIAFAISANVVQEPIFPLHLLSRLNVVTNYVVLLLGIVTQMSLMTIVPIYFQATTNASVAVAGLYLIPAFIGNTVGGLLTGYWIRHTGYYKVATVVGPLLGMLCAGLVFTWNGYTSPAEALFIFPGGFSMGVLASSTFVGMIASLEEQYIAIASTGIYLAFNVGGVAAVSAGSAAFQGATRTRLWSQLNAYDNRDEIIKSALSELSYTWQDTNDQLRQILIEGYATGLHAVNVLGFACSVAGFVFAVISRGKRLERNK